MFSIILSVLSSLSAIQSTDQLPSTLSAEYIQMVDSADYFIAQENWVDAKRCTVNALKIDPSNYNNSLLFSNLGIINTNLGLIDEAIENYSLGLTIAPASSTLRANRARAYLLNSDYADAQKDLLILTEAQPDNDWAWKMLGTTYLAQRNSDEAIKCFTRIVSPDADTLRMIAAILVEKKDFDKALIYYDRLLEESPSEETWFDHAWFLLLSNDVSGAKEDIRQGLKMYPKSGSLVLLRAYIHKLMHENSLSEMDIKLAKEYGVEDQLIDSFFPPKRKKK